MLKLFRAMLKDHDGAPLCGDEANMLGVRVPVDVKPDQADNVHPGARGMSVTPSNPARLPPHLRPVQLGGFGALPVYGIEDGHIGERLAFFPDPRKPEIHGVIHPSSTMPLADYRAALAATKPVWRVVE